MKKVDIKSVRKNFQASETVKTVATVIAVLLIPAAMFAWNYFENQKREVEGQTSSQSTVAKEEPVKEEASQSTEKVEPTENKTVSEIIGGEAPKPATAPVPTPAKEQEKAKLVVDEVKELPFTSSEEEE